MLPTALVVEDNSAIREFIRIKLETSGWRVQEAENASSALRQFHHERPHLVTLDLIMPIDEGLDAIHLARMINEEAPDVALLIVTAYAGEKDIKDFMRKHDLELFDKSEDPFLKDLFLRINVLHKELRTQNI